MSILLPASPGIQTAKPRLLDFGATQTPPMGGPAQRLNRLGNRFAIDVTLPPASSFTDGPVFVSRLMQGLTEGVLYPFPQDMLIGAPGTSIEVNGGAQQGSSLQLKGFPAGYTVAEGQFASIIYAGRRYLHAATAATTATSGGLMNLPIVPMLRISPNDSATVEFAQPMIEGFLSGNSLEWQLRTAPYIDVVFTITEAA
jgi:hypothetical protein